MLAELTGGNIIRRVRALASTVAIVATTTALTLSGTPAGALLPPPLVLNLQLNEALGETTAWDTSGLSHHATIGSHVVMNSSYADWDRHPPGEGTPYGYDHLIAVPDAADGSLDPGSGNFSVEIRFRTKENFGNVIQKGQSSTVGGQVKFQIPQGKMTCMFKTPQGTATAGSGLTLLNNNQWHVVRCDRTQNSVMMYVDGVQTGRSNHFTGALDNKKPWTLGGKSECDATTITCDYFAGEIDYVQMSKGQG